MTMGHPRAPHAQRYIPRRLASVIICLPVAALITSCAPREAHDHVAVPGRPESLESGRPTWVEEFSRNATRTERARPHVLLISLDTLRADHLGAWGYRRATSPFVDELARFGVRFDQAFSHAPKTAPSHMSVFTGFYPSGHGAHIDEWAEPPVVVPVPRALVTLPELMRDAGYRTAAWTGGGQVSEALGFARGFELFRENLGTVTPEKLLEIRAWFEASGDRPCFLFLHTYQIHDPYLPPQPYDDVFAESKYDGWVIGRRAELAGENVYDFPTLHGAFWHKVGRKVDPSRVGPKDLARLVELYDGGIRYTDDVLQGFFQDLRDDGLLDNTLVIVFSDHGEEFLEHGGLLHEKLYQETLHVPLIFFWPARLPHGLTVDSRVPLMDLAPTLLELVGLEPPSQSDAHSLTPLLTGGGGGGSRTVFSESPWFHEHPYRSLRDGDVMVYDHGNGTIELYNLAVDPLETTDLGKLDPELAGAQTRVMESFLAAHHQFILIPDEPGRELSEEEIEALRALGYVH